MSIIDIARDHFEIIIYAVAGVCFGLAWAVNQGALRLSRDIDAKLKAFRAEVDHEKAYSTEVARIIELGMQIMTPAQVEQWAGAKEFLTAYGGGSAETEDDGAEDTEVAREGHPGAKTQITVKSFGRTVLDTTVPALDREDEMELEMAINESGRLRAHIFTETRGEAEAEAIRDDLQRRGFELTSAQIADTLRLGITDLDEPPMGDSGFPDWTPKSERPF